MKPRPCPFCGEGARLVDGDGYTSISHDGCTADVGGFEGDGAAEAWNNRAIEDCLLDALREAEAVINALDGSGYSQGDVLATIRAAIAKAEA